MQNNLSSKAAAVAWALDALPEPYRSTVECSQTWKDGSLIDPSTLVPEVRQFVLWTASEGQAFTDELCR